MARIILTYQCGHTTTTSAPGRQAAFLQHRASADICYGCHHDDENLRSTQDNILAGMPALTGKSDRQMAYGETCRVHALTVIVGDLDQELPETTRRAFRDWLYAHTDAGWWCNVGRLNHEAMGLKIGELYYADTGNTL